MSTLRFDDPLCAIEGRWESKKESEPKSCPAK